MEKQNSQRKMVKTYLDDIPWGPEDALEQDLKKTRKERKKLPEGCKTSVLYQDIMRIAWPSLVELMLTSLVSMADMMMVGSMPNGDDAISAVSLAAQPKFIFVSLLIALNVGVTAAIARSRGAGNHEEANRTLCQGVLISLLVSVFGSVMGIVFAKPLVRFMATAALSEEICDLSVQYLVIQMAGFVTMGVTTTFTAAFRGTGNSKLPLYYNMTANVLNVIGNYLLINGHFGFPALGVVGASLATVIGQAVAMVIALYYIFSGTAYFHVPLNSFAKNFKPDGKIMGRIVKVGMPSLGEQFIMRIGVILFSRQVASLGQPYYATHQICMNVQSLSFMLGQAMAVSATTLVGQSLGKRRPDMAEHYSRRCASLGILISLGLAVFLLTCGKFVVGLYSDTAEVIAASGPVLLILAALQPVQTPQFILTGSLRGAGDTRSTAIITLVGVLILRPVIAYFAINVLNLLLIGAWLAIAADQIGRTALVSYIYGRGKWKKIRL